MFCLHLKFMLCPVLCCAELALNYSYLLPLFSAELLFLQGRRENTPGHPHSRKDDSRQGLTMSTHSPTPLLQQKGATLGVVAICCSHTHTHTHTHTYTPIYVCICMRVSNLHTCTHTHTQACTVPISCYHIPHHLPPLITTIFTTCFASIHPLSRPSLIQQPLTSCFTFHPVPLGHRRDWLRK